MLTSRLNGFPSRSSSPAPDSERSQCDREVTQRDASGGAHLVVHEYVHDVLVDLPGQPVFWPPGDDDKLYSEQRHQDQRGPHRLHVHVGLGAVRVPQLGHQHSDDVQQEEEIHLQRRSKKKKKHIISLLFILFGEEPTN